MRDVIAAGLIALAGLGWGAAEAAEMPRVAYAGSETCAECHKEAADAWSGSHHALAWTEPGPETVAGDFDDAEFEHHGVVTRFRRDGDAYLIETEDADGARGTWKVVGVGGYRPLQQYLVETEPGRTQTFDIAWDMDEGRWYPVFPDQDLVPGDALHWTGPYKSWEARCAECHATGYTRNYDPATRTYAPRMAEIGVGCEACHGPGSAHLAWAAEPGAYDPTAWEGTGGTGLTVDLGASASVETGQCAACHSRREAFFDGNSVPGTAYGDAYNLALLREGLYHADGQILDEVYVYGSFLQSKMNARGVRCTDCHEPHSATLRAEGNAVCAQCHNPEGNERFPTLRGAAYDTPEHHFHEEGTEGALCVSCHMIERTYMGIDERRDHSFRVPRPDLAAGTGAPDACTDCHADRDAAWAAAEIAARFPEDTHRGPHFGTVLAAARWSPEGQIEPLLALAGDAETPGIVRATALDLLARARSEAAAEGAATLLADPDPLVRAAAATAQRARAPEARLAALAPALSDPVRMVRIAAAGAMLDAVSAIPPEAGAALRGPMTEWQAAQVAQADFPETHLRIGGVALTMRDWEGALAGFREAVTLDPQLVDAWSMLVRVDAALERPDRARATLAEALAANPGNAALEELRRGL